jgi:hypothetical protein
VTGVPAAIVITAARGETISLAAALPIMSSIAALIAP